MTNEELIEKYSISLTDDKNLKLIAKIDTAALVEVKANKPEIVAILIAKKDAAAKSYADYKAKVNAIEGLKEIEALKNEWNRYDAAFNRMMSTGSSVMTVGLPSTKTSDMISKYPRAAAYLKAQSWHDGSHFVKSTAGKKAEEKILNGEDYTTAITEMEKEWSDYTAEHVFD